MPQGYKHMDIDIENTTDPPQIQPATLKMIQ